MRLTKIGNSPGVRIPKPIIQQTGLDKHEFERRVVNNGLLLSPLKSHRQEWAAAAQEQYQVEKEGKPILDGPNEFDEQEWTW